VLGHVVSPGCVSFYKKDGKMFAPPPGRWFLTSYKAKWNEQDDTLNHDKIDIKRRKSQVLIICVPLVRWVVFRITAYLFSWMRGHLTWVPSRMQGPSTGSPAFTLTMESAIAFASHMENMPRFGQKKPKRRTVSRLWCCAYLQKREILLNPTSLSGLMPAMSIFIMVLFTV
jgi:hypothetical protein